MRSAPSIAFDYRPSRTLASMIVALTVLAAGAIGSCGLAWPWALVAMGIAIAYGAIALWRHMHPRVRALAWQGDGSVSLTLAGRDGIESPRQGTLVEARVFDPLIVLSLRWPQGRAALWLLPDNLDADARRRLRMRIKLDGALSSVNADGI